MTKQITPKDWQTLSEYLDGQLSNRERVQIEARLQTSVELRSGLDELKRTRAILRTLPKRRAPRNFILTPAMVPQRRISPPRAFPYLRLASALASVLLVITFLSDLAVHNQASFATSSGSAPAVEAPAAAPQLPANPSAPNAYPQPNAAAPAAATQAPAATTAPAAPPASLLAPAPTETPPAPPSLAAAPQATEAPTSEAARSMAAGSGPVEDETQQAIAAMTAAPQGLGEGPNPATTSVPGGGSSEATAVAPRNFAQTLETPTPATAQDLAPHTQAYPAPDTFAPKAPAPNQKVNPNAEAPQPAPSENPPFELASLLRPAEILFAIIAVLTGLAAYIVYRAGRT